MVFEKITKMVEFEYNLVLQLFGLLSTTPVPDQKMKSENKTSTSVQ